jgi:hypothetical protein
MFPRTKTEPTAEPVFGPRPTASAPDGPPVAPTPANEVAEGRTTCYPADAAAPPPVVGQPRTTVYRQAVRWNRGGYDTLN